MKPGCCYTCGHHVQAHTAPTPQKPFDDSNTGCYRYMCPCMVFVSTVRMKGHSHA
jgi:hypothetical protein